MLTPPFVPAIQTMLAQVVHTEQAKDEKEIFQILHWIFSTSQMSSLKCRAVTHGNLMLM